MPLISFIVLSSKNFNGSLYNKNDISGDHLNFHQYLVYIDLPFYLYHFNLSYLYCLSFVKAISVDKVILCT